MCVCIYVRVCVTIASRVGRPYCWRLICVCVCVCVCVCECMCEIVRERESSNISPPCPAPPSPPYMEFLHLCCPHMGLGGGRGGLRRGLHERALPLRRFEERGGR